MIEFDVHSHDTCVTDKVKLKIDLKLVFLGQFCFPRMFTVVIMDFRSPFFLKLHICESSWETCSSEVEKTSISLFSLKTLKNLFSYIEEDYYFSFKNFVFKQKKN